MLPIRIELTLVFATTLFSVSLANEFCSFFNNRSPGPQPGLKNCTWFRRNSCCRQEEIDATFGRVKPLPGSSPVCQRYTNYLMCYICAPHQNLFYSRERLIVCEEFCDAWYDACKSVVLKGSTIKSLYKNGITFCKSRSFGVESIANGKCFFYDSVFETSSASDINGLACIFVIIWTLLLITSTSAKIPW